MSKSKVSTEYVGNFPVISDQGEVVDPLPRFRARLEYLDNSGREIPDPCPVASAVAFAEDISVEDRVRMMIAQSEADMERRLSKADEADIEFYDDEDHQRRCVDNINSPYEFVHNPTLGIETPRGLLGMFKRKPKPVQDDLPFDAPASALAPSPSKKGISKSSKAIQAAEDDSSTDPD